jgi:uncharacterized membrane protein
MQTARTISRYILSLFFIVAGIGHFIIPDFYLRMMPNYIPFPLSMVYLSGLGEIVLGLFGLLPGFFAIAKFGMIALLIAVFPANIQMALHPELFPELEPSILLFRLPFQLVFIAWVLFSFHQIKRNADI